MDTIVEYYVKHIIPLSLILMLLTSINLRKQKQSDFRSEQIQTVQEDIRGYAPKV